MRSLLRLRDERDPFVRIAGTGLACAFGVQALINMGVAVRLLPTRGMTLPFVSYGGSSVIASGIAMGILLALTRSRRRARWATFWDGAGDDGRQASCLIAAGNWRPYNFLRNRWPRCCWPRAGA